MPLIISMEQLADRIIVTRSNGNKITLTVADIPPNVANKTAPEIELWCNDKLTTLTAGTDFFAKVKILSVAPITFKLIMSDKPMAADFYGATGG